MAFPFPPGPNQPIPNNPFYYPETNYLKGEYGPFIVGSGFTINNATGTIEVSGGGSGAPTILAGLGIAVTSGTGTVTITNTGIRTVTAGAGISVSVAGGNLNIVNTLPAIGTPGTVTQVSTGTGLTGGPITTSGTIALDTVSTVAPGTYTNATITVDAYGRVTYAAPGSGALGSLIQATAPLSVNASIPQTISISAASTAAPGAVQLNTAVNSTSTTQAATPSAVKQAYDLGFTASANASNALTAATTATANAATAQTTANNALSTATAAQATAVTAQSTANTALTNAAAAQNTANAAIPRACFTVKGQVLAGTGAGTLVALNPGLNGQVLVACSTASSGLCWVTQPVAAGTVTLIGTGPGLSGGPITSSGTISLVPSGVTASTYTYSTVTVDAYGRVTAASSGAPPIPCACITGKGSIITGSVANFPVALPVGSDGRVLTACSACALGITWAPASASTAAIPCACITGKGALITGTSASTISTLPVGTNGYVLTADSTAANGLCWAPAAVPITSATPTVEGSVFASTDNAAPFATALGFNALNTAVTGVGNVAIGTCSGCSLSSGQFNTYVGSGAGVVSTTGSNNISLGSQSLSALTTGSGNIAIGNLAGLGLTTECNNVILGPATGEVGCNNNVFIASGDGTVRLRFNQNGALGIAGASFGTNGQVLTSAGPGAAPTWTTIGGGTVTSVTGTAPIAVTAGTTPVVSIAAASTTGTGAVQLYDNVDSTSTTLALTAAQGKVLQDQITGLVLAGTVELAGTIDASVGGIVLSVTSVGTSDGYVVGNALPAASATTNNTYVIVTTPGTMTPPGGSPTVATRGDWFLVSETSPSVYEWTFLNVGFDVSYATTTSSGVVCLATNAQAQAGTNTLTALTPAAAASAYISKSCITAKGDLISGTAANTPTSLTVGTDGQVLVACSMATSGLCWVTVPSTLPATPTALGTVLGCTIATNTALGCNALLANTGPGNVAVGVCALASNTTSDRNTAVGDCALRLNTIGVNNVALGALSMFKNTTGGFNVSIGRNSMCSNTTGNCNVSVGNNSGCSITTGVQNVAIGSDALCSSTIYNQNTAVGAAALRSFNGGPVGSGANDAFGSYALCSLTTGDYNVSLGGWSLFNFANGCCNTAVGHRAMSGPTGGNGNTALGFYAGCNITTGSQNVAIGNLATVCNPSGSCQLAIGFAAGQNWLTGDSNKNIRPGNGIIDCIGSVGTVCQVLRTTGTGALQWSSIGATSSGIVSLVSIANQWVTIDDLQFGMWNGCKSFVMRPVSGTLTATWGVCYVGSGGGYGAGYYQDIAFNTWRFLWDALNMPSHGQTMNATICVVGTPTRMYQFTGMVGASYCCNPISITRVL
jgi:hypothetical protein